MWPFLGLSILPSLTCLLGLRTFATAELSSLFLGLLAPSRRRSTRIRINLPLVTSCDNAYA